MSAFDFKGSGEAAIDGDWIVMKVAIPALTTIVGQSPDLCGIKVTNAPAFAVDLVRALNEAAEDGTTPLHRMFDCVIAAAIDDGSEHVEDTGEPTCVQVTAATCGTCGGSGCAPGSGYYWPDNPPPPCPDCDGPIPSEGGRQMNRLTCPKCATSWMEPLRADCPMCALAASPALQPAPVACPFCLGRPHPASEMCKPGRPNEAAAPQLSVPAEPRGEVTRVDGWERSIPWPDPTLEMFNDDPVFEAIWQAIKRWDINVPGAYSGYMGATGNHVRAILDAIRAEPAAPPAGTGGR